MIRTTFFGILAGLAVCVPGAAQAPYKTAPGQTAAVSPLDPFDAARRPPGKPGQPRQFRPTIPLADYLARTYIDASQRPGKIGPPQLETRNLTGNLAPDLLTAQSLQLTPSLNWEGNLQTMYTPPSPGIAVGPSDVLLAVHNTIARYTRDGVRTDLLTFEQWFADQIAVICTSGFCSYFDPALHYDQLHGRFLFMISAADDLTGKSYFLLSVSNGATYAGGWKTWTLDASLNGQTPTSESLDFGQFGFDNEAVYLTANMFNVLNTFVYSKVRILKKAELYNPATTVLTYRDFWDLRNTDDSDAKSLMPVHLRGRVGEPGSPGYMVNAVVSQPSTEITMWRINNPASDAPTLDRIAIPGVWQYDLPKIFPQLGSNRAMNPVDTRIPQAILRNGVITFGHNTGYVDEPTTVTYDRIDVATRKITLQARMINGAFFFPAFDVPATIGPGNVLPNVLTSGANVNAQGQLTYLSILGVKEGEAPFEIASAKGSDWGYNFGATIDPVHGGLWTYGAYARARQTNEGGRWGTRVAYTPWSAPSLFTDVSSSDPQSPFVNVLGLWQITRGCAENPARFCPDNAILRGEMAVFIIRSMLGDSFTSPTTPYFTDVPPEHPFFRYIQKLRQLGITSGCTESTFCPGNPVTRSEMAVFIIRAKLRAIHGDNIPAPGTPYFDDVPAGSARFAFVQKLRELGITSGCTETRFCPDDTVTRGQTAVFLVRAFLN